MVVCPLCTVLHALPLPPLANNLLPPSVCAQIGASLMESAAPSRCIQRTRVMDSVVDG